LNLPVGRAPGLCVGAGMCAHVSVGVSMGVCMHQGERVCTYMCVPECELQMAMLAGPLWGYKATATCTWLRAVMGTTG
jgi:hypothetical protein